MNDSQPYSPGEAERFAHLTYGALVKHFGLGTTHTFSSWPQLPENDREKWLAALAEVNAEMKAPANKT